MDEAGSQFQWAFEHPRLAAFGVLLVVDCALMPAAALFIWGQSAWFPIVIMGVLLVMFQLGSGVVLLISPRWRRFSGGILIAAIAAVPLILTILIVLLNDNYWLPPPGVGS